METTPSIDGLREEVPRKIKVICTSADPKSGNFSFASLDANPGASLNLVSVMNGKWIKGQTFELPLPSEA